MSMQVSRKSITGSKDIICTSLWLLKRDKGHPKLNMSQWYIYASLMNIKPLVHEICSLGKFIFCNLAFNFDKMIKVNKSQWTPGAIQKVYLCQFGANQAKCSKDISMLLCSHSLNDVAHELQQSASIAAVLGAVHPSIPCRASRHVSGQAY